MLDVKNLESLIKIENDLKSQYEDKLNAKDAEISAQAASINDLQNTITKQKENIIEFSSSAADSKRIEQTNRELNNRASKLQEEVEAQKKRIKTMQKELAEERAENKSLKQYDAEKLKKNLAANKKKLAEKTAGNELLQKTISKIKGENADFQREIAELKAKLEELQPAEATDVEGADIEKTELETAEA